MGKIGISWYKPYKSPEDFFAQKVHDYNDIMRLTNADPERINSIGTAIESFINNERFHSIDSKFINTMIRHDDPRYDKVLESYISHTIDKISTDGVSNDSGHWSLLTQMDKIRSQYNLCKVTESADCIYNKSLADMARVQIDANTYLETDEVDRILQKFGTEITMESILNWNSSSLRKELSMSDPNTANICDMICNNESSYYDLAVEDFKGEEDDKINFIINSIDREGITSTVIDSVRLIFAQNKTSEDIITALAKYYGECSFSFSPEIFAVLICKLSQAKLLSTSFTGLPVEEIPNEFIHRIEESGHQSIFSNMANESLDAANAVPGNNYQGMINNYNLINITPGMTYNEAIQEYVWLNRAYNDIIFKLDKLKKNGGVSDKISIYNQLMEKKDYLNDVLNAINSCARTTFKFSSTSDIQAEPESQTLIQFVDSTKPMDIPTTPAITALLESLTYSGIEYTRAIEASEEEDDEEENEKFSMCPAELTMNMNMSAANKSALENRIMNGLIKAGLSKEKASRVINGARNAAIHLKLKDLTQDNEIDWKKYAERYLEYAGISPDSKPENDNTHQKNLTDEESSEKSNSTDKTSKIAKAQAKIDEVRQKAIDAKNKAEDKLNERRRLKSEGKFQRETSDTALQWKRYKKNMQEVDLKLTNALKDLTRVVFVGKSTNETRREIIEGKNYSVMTLLKQILGGFMVFSTSKIAFILLLIVRMCKSGKVKRSEKKKILMELEGELQMIDEKIRDASADGNREAKYALMRNKINLENAISRIKMNTEMDKYSAGSARDVAVNEIRS